MKSRKTGKKEKCCSSDTTAKHPDHSAELNRLRRVVGQLEGVGRMIEERRYCPDILTQLQAASSAIWALQGKILERHLTNCVRQSFENPDEKEKEEKIAELLEIFTRYARN